MSSDRSGEIRTETMAFFATNASECEPVTTAELVEEIDAPPKTVKNQLETLAEAGELHRKEVGPNTTVWWQPPSTTDGRTNGASHLGEIDCANTGQDEPLEAVSSTGVWKYDIQADDGWASDEVKQIHGLSATADLTPAKSLDHYHPADRPTVKAAFERAVENQEPYELELRFVTAEDTVRFVRTVGGVYCEDGEPVYIFGTLRDITPQRHRRRKLEAKSKALEAVPTGVTITDPTREDNPLTYVNDHFQQVTGYSEREALERNCRFLQGEDTDPESVSQLREAVEASEEETVELRNYRKDGTSFWNRVSIAPIENDDGTLINYVGFQEEITAQKQYKEVLEKRERILRELHTTTQKLHSVQTKDAVAEVLQAALADVFGFAYAGIMLFDEDEGVLEMATMSPSMAEQFTQPPVVEPGSNPIWTAFCEEQTQRLTGGQSVSTDAEIVNMGTEMLIVPMGGAGVLVAATVDGAGFEENTVDSTELLTAHAEAIFQRIYRKQQTTELTTELHAQNSRITELEQITQSVKSIQHRLAESKTREQIEAVVCEELTKTEIVDFAWIGHPQTTEAALSPAEWAGDTNGYLDLIETTTETGLPAQQAAKTRQTTAIESIAQYGRRKRWAKTAISAGFKSVLSLPLVYDDVLYGVLTVYSKTDAAFDGIYQQTFEDIASLLSSRIGLFRQQSTDDGPRVRKLEFEFSDMQYPLQRLASEADCELSFVTVIETTPETVQLLASVTGGDTDSVAETARELTQVADATWFGDEQNKQLSLTVERPFLTSRLGKHGGRLVGSTTDGEHSSLTVCLPTTASPRPLIEAVSTTYPELTLQSQTTTARRDIPQRPESVLTDRQFEILKAAYHGGYYETPRAVNGTDLAEQFDISNSAVHVHLQTAHRKLLAQMLEPVNPDP